MSTLRVYRMRADAVIPRYKTSDAAGMDLAACLDAPLTIEPGGIARVPTGLRIALPAGHEGQVRPRSGLAARHAVTVLNAPGTIDEDYRGEVQVLLGQPRHRTIHRRNGRSHRPADRCSSNPGRDHDGKRRSRPRRNRARRRRIRQHWGLERPIHQLRDGRLRSSSDVLGHELAAP